MNNYLNKPMIPNVSFDNNDRFFPFFFPFLGPLIVGGVLGGAIVAAGRPRVVPYPVPAPYPVGGYGGYGYGGSPSMVYLDQAPDNIYVSGSQPMQPAMPGYSSPMPMGTGEFQGTFETNPMMNKMY